MGAMEINPKLWLSAWRAKDFQAGRELASGGSWLAALRRKAVRPCCQCWRTPELFLFHYISWVNALFQCLGGKIREISGVVACGDKAAAGDWCSQGSVCCVGSHLVLFKLHRVTFEEGEMWQVCKNFQVLSCSLGHCFLGAARTRSECVAAHRIICFSAPAAQSQTSLLRREPQHLHPSQAACKDLSLCSQPSWILNGFAIIMQCTQNELVMISSKSWDECSWGLGFGFF